MELNKTNWQSSDREPFIKYLKQHQRSEDKRKWEKGIINTNYECLAILSKDIKEISNQIAKGNIISFIDLQMYDNFPAITIMGNLICKIKDFTLLKHYLDLYSEKIDNWSNCDQLKFKIINSNKENFLNLALEYLLSPLPFRRRIAIIIMFNFINDNDIDRVFKTANSLYKEDNYYVNMANAWLICECFIKCKTKTQNFLKHHALNKFTLNKMISKCCDSYRVSSEDKTLLKQMRIK